MFCRNVGTAKQLINNCKALLSQQKLRPSGNGWFQFRNTFRSSRHHRGKHAGFEPDPLGHLHIESGPLHATGLVKPFLFTIGVSTVSLVGCVVWEYENLRIHASNLLRRPGTWLSAQQKKIMGHKSESTSVKKWWNSLKDSEKVFYPILAANVLVFGAWRVRALQPFMVKYFCSNPSGSAVCLPMLLSTFSHYSALHLAANMYVLYSFMPAAMASLGKEQFVAMYLSAGVISSFASFMYKILLNQPGLSLGASGAIMAVLSYVCVQYPDTRLSIIFLPMYTFAAGSAIKVIMGIDLAGVMFGWKFFDHAAHLGGALFGIWVYVFQNTSLFAPQLLNINDKSPGDIQPAFRAYTSTMNSDFDTPPALSQIRTSTSQSPMQQNYDEVSPALSQIRTSTSQSPMEQNYDEDNIHEALARALYVSGAPLSLLEHPLWKGALNMLNPRYIPPSSKVLSSTLLEKEYTKMQTVIEKTVKQSSVINFAIDGWENKSFINMILYAPMPIFYKYFVTSDSSHNLDLLFQKTLEIINHFGAEKFFGIIADNTENMIKCGDLITQKYPHVIWLACLAHTLHLLIGEITKSPKVREWFSQIEDITKTVMNSDILKARFMKLAKENNLNAKIILPVKDNWGSYLLCLQSFLKSKTIFQKMAGEGYQQLDEYKTILLDEATWRELNKLEEFLTPTIDWILKLKNDNSAVHLVHKVLKELGELLNNALSKEFLGEDLNAIKANFNDRKSYALKPIHLAAAILDPKNHGSTLTCEEYLEGNEYIINTLTSGKYHNVEQVLVEFTNYKNRTDVWQKDLVWQKAETLTPLEWWQALNSKTDLGELAMKILSVPATSTLAETSSLTFTNIPTYIRNRLKGDVAEKINFISHNWEIINRHIGADVTRELNIDASEDKDDLLEVKPALHSSNHDQSLVLEESIIKSIGRSVNSIVTDSDEHNDNYYHRHYKDYL